MQNREFAAHSAMHWCFNCFSQITNWVRLKFGQQFNRDIIFLQKNFRETHFVIFGFMIKFVTVAATGNFVAPSYKTALQIP
jgi:hypothetical protein